MLLYHYTVSITQLVIYLVKHLRKPRFREVLYKINQLKQLPHQKEETSKGLNYVAGETVSEADAMLEKKGENKKIHELENGKHSTYHSE